MKKGVVPSPDTAPREGDGAAHAHVVDQLIEERAPRLSRTRAWPLLSALLKPLLSYRAARQMADEVAPLSGVAAFEHVSALLHLDVTAVGLANVPQTGRCLVVANHPTGIADGFAVYDVLKTVRQDVTFFANADALRVCPGLRDVVIPVVWPAHRRTLASSRATLRAARRAIGQERAVVVFAAGAIARRIGGVVQDPAWEHSAIALARHDGVPVVPAHVAGPYPFWFHTLGACSQELRDITLFHEFLNKAGRPYRVVFGAPVDPGALEGGDEAVTRRLKAHVETVLPAAPDARFDPTQKGPGGTGPFQPRVA